MTTVDIPSAILLGLAVWAFVVVPFFGALTLGGLLLAGTVLG